MNARQLLLAMLMVGSSWMQAAEVIGVAERAPDLKLVGIFNTQNNNSRAIIVKQNKQRLVAQGDMAFDGWHLISINNEFVLLERKHHTFRLKLSQQSPASFVEQSDIAPRAGARLIAVHTNDSHSELEAGQYRRLYELAEEQTAVIELSREEQNLKELVDHGMLRRFSHQPVPTTAIYPESSDSSASHLEPGQSITFAELPAAPNSISIDH